MPATTVPYAKIRSEDEVYEGNAAPPAPNSLAEALPCIPVAECAPAAAGEQIPVAPPVVAAEAAAEPADAAEDGLPRLLLRLKTPSDVTWELAVPLQCSVAELKNRLAERSETPPARQRLIFRGAILAGDDARSLASYGVESGAVLHFVPRPEVVQAAEADPAAVVVGVGQFMLPRSFPGSAAAAARRVAPRTPDMARWTSRTRMLCSVMLFFYALGLIGAMASWINPSDKKDGGKDGDQQDQGATTNNAASKDSTQRMITVMENVFGLTNAFAGLKASSTLDVRLSARFLRGMVLLSIFYAVTTSLKVTDLVKDYTHSGGTHAVGEEGDGETDGQTQDGVTAGGLALSLVTYLAAGTIVWTLCMFVAVRFHKAVVQHTLAVMRAASIAVSGQLQVV